MFTIASCLLVRLGSGLDSVSGWYVVMHTLFCYFRSLLSHCRQSQIIATLHQNLAFGMFIIHDVKLHSFAHCWCVALVWRIISTNCWWIFTILDCGEAT